LATQKNLLANERFLSWTKESHGNHDSVSVLCDGSLNHRLISGELEMQH
jgi:hypothetical protein